MKILLIYILYLTKILKIIVIKKYKKYFFFNIKYLITDNIDKVLEFI